MKKLVMLLVVLALCMPAYGYILVYKVTMSGTSAEFETDGSSGWLLKKDSEKSYLVLDVNDEDPNALNGVQLVDYYTDGRNKLYEIETAEDFKQTILPGRPPKGKNIAHVDIDLTGATGLLLGTVSSTDIGTFIEDEPPIHLKVDNVATSLKGVCVNDTPDNEIGYGTLSLTLDSKWTKTANNPDETKGFGGDIDFFLDPTSGPSEDDPTDEPKPPMGFIYWLEKNGYSLAED